MLWTFSDDQMEKKTTDVYVAGEKMEPATDAAAPDGEGWKKVGDLKRSEAIHYKSRGLGYGSMDGPFTVFFQKWERQRAPEKREGDCSLTI